MPRIKKAKTVIAVKCDYCGDTTETFVVNAEKLRFCINQYPGHEPTKDCLTDYVTDYEKKKKKQKESLFSQKKKQLQEEQKILTDKTSVLKKLEELKQFLSKKKTNHPS